MKKGLDISIIFYALVALIGISLFLFNLRLEDFEKEMKSLPHRYCHTETSVKPYSKAFCELNPLFENEIDGFYRNDDGTCGAIEKTKVCEIR